MHGVLGNRLPYATAMYPSKASAQSVEYRRNLGRVEGGFENRDPQPFCFNKGDGKTVASTVPGLGSSFVEKRSAVVNTLEFRDVLTPRAKIDRL